MEMEWLSEWLSDCCLMPNEHIFSNIMTRTNYISMRWWRCTLCPRSTNIVRFFSANSLRQACLPSNHYNTEAFNGNRVHILFYIKSNKSHGSPNQVKWAKFSPYISSKSPSLDSKAKLMLPCFFLQINI